MSMNLSHDGIQQVRMKRRFSSKEEAKRRERWLLSLGYDTYRRAGGSVVTTLVYADRVSLFAMEGWIIICPCNEIESKG